MLILLHNGILGAKAAFTIEGISLMDDKARQEQVEPVLVDLGDTDRAYERNAMKVWAGEGDFLALLEADPEVSLPTAALEACFDIAYHTKHVDEVFERVLGGG